MASQGAGQGAASPAAADAGAAAGAAVPAASAIALKLVSTYYKMLHEKPESVSVFYGDDSHLARLELGAPFADSDVVVGAEAITARIRELRYQNCKVKIESVDSQYSLDHSVFIMVTGRLWNATWPRPRLFSQSFLLSGQNPDANGMPTAYYVRNDLLRLLHEAEDDAVIIPAGQRAQPAAAPQLKQASSPRAAASPASASPRREPQSPRAPAAPDAAPAAQAAPPAVSEPAKPQASSSPAAASPAAAVPAPAAAAAAAAATAATVASPAASPTDAAAAAVAGSAATEGDRGGPRSRSGPKKGPMRRQQPNSDEKQPPQQQQQQQQQPSAPPASKPAPAASEEKHEPAAKPANANWATRFFPPGSAKIMAATPSVVPAAAPRAAAASVSAPAPAAGAAAAAAPAVPAAEDAPAKPRQPNGMAGHRNPAASPASSNASDYSTTEVFLQPPNPTQADQIKALMAKFGEVKSVVKNKAGYLVEYASPQDAQNAVKNSPITMDEQPVKIRFRWFGAPSGPSPSASSGRGGGRGGSSGGRGGGAKPRGPPRNAAASDKGAAPAAATQPNGVGRQ